MHYNRFEKDNRLAIINLIDDEFLQCSFFENEQIVGRIDYPDNSRDFVVSAAENWCEGIMTEETVKNYTKQLDLFAK